MPDAIILMPWHSFELNHHFLENSPKDDDDDGDISDDTTEFDNGSSSTATGSKSAEQRSDPMSILCSTGLHEASTFCYERISEVKEHVRSVHDFSPSVMAGNNLFHRFQVSVCM